MAHFFSVYSLLLLLALSLLSFFFSASETSLIGLSRIRLRHMASRSVRGAKNVQNLISNLDKFIVAILVGNNFVNIAFSAIVTAAFVRVFGYNWGVVLATLASAFFILIICEITPKILAIKHTERTVLLIAPLMEVFIKVFNPVISIFKKAGDIIIKLMRIKPSKRSPLVTEEELRLMIEIGREEGFLSDEEARLLQRIFEFGDIVVKDVMVPKDKIISVNIKTPAEELLNIFVEEGHARLPVYNGSVDNITGIIYARDLLYVLRDKRLFVLEDLIRLPYYVAAGTRVNELLKKFQADKAQLAVVVDEHRRTLGLVTLEDLIEEIVGEIEEEHAGLAINKS